MQKKVRELEADLKKAGSRTAEAKGIATMSTRNIAQLRKVVRPLRIDGYLQNRGTTVIALMREAYGLELQFGGVASLDASAFTNLLLYRDRELDARGWTGALPKGLAFDDSPEVVFKKMQRPADVASEADFDGYALWRFPEHDLQVHYSTMDNWILNFRILAPGVWDGDGAGTHKR
jgi:hypothetical protein